MNKEEKLSKSPTLIEGSKRLVPRYLQGNCHPTGKTCEKGNDKEKGSQTYKVMQESIDTLHKMMICLHEQSLEIKFTKGRKLKRQKKKITPSKQPGKNES